MPLKKEPKTSKWMATKMPITTKKPIYVLNTFDGGEIVYNNFDEAVDAAEFGDYCSNTNQISGYYETFDEDGIGTRERIPDGDPYDGRWTEEEGIITEPSKVFTEAKNLKEAISFESDLLLKLNPLSEAEIFEFMKNLRGGTYFNMGMYSSIPVARAYKSTIRIYKVIDLTAIVSGVSYENIGTTKDFRQRTGEAPGKAWYDHTPGYENKIAQKKSDPSSKYVLWDIKRGTGTCVRYYVVDIETSKVTPVSKTDVENSPYLTASEKAKLTPKPVVGFDLATGEVVENKTNWRTAAFDHIFWLNQAGKSTQEYGVRFEEDFDLEEATNSGLFMDAHAHVKTDLDAILSGEVVESVKKPLEETTDADIFMDAHAGVKTRLNDVLSGKVTEDWINPETWTEKTAPDEIYVVLTGDGPEYENVFLTFDGDGDYYTTVDYLDEVGIWDLHQSISGAISRAKDADSSTLGGWPEEMHIAKITNFKEAFFNGADPEYTIVKTLTDADLVNKSSTVTTEAKKLKESYRRIVSRGSALVDNELFVDFD